MGKVVLEQVLLQVLVSLSQYHSTNAPYSFIRHQNYATLATDSQQFKNNNEKIQQTVAGKFFTRNLNPSITEGPI
jgi:hypothetical protein